MMASQDTIYALSSAAGKSAVAVVRISGAACRGIASSMAAPMPTVRQAALRTIRHPHSKDKIDSGLVLFFPAPASATGEDLLEFQVHGGRAVLNALFAALAEFPSCRPAEPGEFIRRGFENGKLDLTAAEGIADLIDAETDAQRRQANRQASGQLAQLYDGWRTQIIQAQGLVEASIDFSDEADVAAGAVAQARAVARSLKAQIEAHLAGARRGEIIRDGFRVVIAGPPNAGKSSLLNALARRDAAIVSDEAGTTRDIVEVHMDLEGLAVIVSDTAGLRDHAGKIEQEGIKRALDRARSADLIIWLDSRDAPAKPPPDLHELPGTVLRVTNKMDLREPGRARAGLGISVRDATGLEQLTDEIVKHARHRVEAHGELVPTSHRHSVLLGEAVASLDAFLISAGSQTELAAEDLRLAAVALGRLTGRIDVEDVLDQIFSRFCIGK
jgi:tRNA modification GTPase